MSITRINEFQAKAGQQDQLRDFLASVIAMVETSAGCLGCQLLQARDEPSRFAIVEVWESVEAHQASVKNIPAGYIEKVMPMLEVPAQGRYYEALTRKDAR